MCPQVAVKIVSKDSIKDVSDIERIYRETFILTNLRHPNIIRLYEVRERERVSLRPEKKEFKRLPYTFENGGVKAYALAVSSFACL